jgi:hypothetical protein
MEKIGYEKFIESEEYLIFKKSVDELFHLLEEETTASTYEFRCKLHKVLSKVYALSWDLPPIELQFETEKEDLLSEHQLKKMNLLISNKLGDKNFYFEVFDPFHLEKEDPTQGWLIDDLSDIYKEIKNGILKIESKKPAFIEDGIWDIVFGRNVHWGNHAINAIRALHYDNYN